MSASKAKGTRWETAVVGYLRWALNDHRIDRCPLHGIKDEGDISGVYFHGRRVVIECKATKRASYSAHWDETIVEMGNADTDLGVVFWKRPGIGIATPGSVGRHLAYMDNATYDEFVTLLPPAAGDDLEHLLETIPRHKNSMIGLSITTFALILNHGLQLGPEDMEEAN